VQREQVMLPLKVFESRNAHWCIGRWFHKASRQQRLARMGKRGKPPRDLSPRRALQGEYVVTKEIRLSALAVWRTF
jgi:hypothetical protein